MPVVAALAFTGNPWMQTIGFTLLCAVYGALLVQVVTAPPGSLRARCFEMGWLRSFGNYSYAMYLFHFFIGILALSVFTPGSYPRFFIPAQIAFWILAIGVTWLLARASWFLLEAPVLRLKRSFPYWPRS